ncbi:hypothetical protein OG369_16225 [Streptomyces sp. NBC_01221]|uniref:hypothetical protein n=1 Tax=Streptomyces sp. NBC_01221 TaxID=2903782 RepID=UPI00224C9C7B|nr:hypothetical protein [Streptomyces sp. NBC_01221]MCX4787676.1 hypothetical protein [Streptomyces sp. NBC_01221]
MAARLSAWGLTPIVTSHGDCIRIEAYVPQSISPELWRELLAALATADCFGLVDSSADGRTLWAGVNKKTPAAVHAARGHGHQP